MDYQSHSQANVDQTDPANWVETLALDQLTEWLRVCFWDRVSYPIIVPPISRMAIEISELLKRGSSSLKTKVRSAIPVLLQEWGRDDPSDTLDDLLITSGRLRCASSESVIIQIANERLGGRQEEVALRQRCLSVLSGLGCTERSRFIFTKYLGDIEYAAICYRALYRFDPTYAASELSQIFRVFKGSDAIDELHLTIKRLFDDINEPNQRVEIVTLFLAGSNPEIFLEVINTLRTLGILCQEFFLSARFSHRVNFFKTLLHRCNAQQLSSILWDFKSIWIELHCIELTDSEANLYCVYEDPITKATTPEKLFSTKDLDIERIAAIQQGGEDVATLWFGITPEGAVN
jgi:hypothetical protein